MERPLKWVPGSKAELLAMPEGVIDMVGYVLGEVQHHRSHPSIKTLTGLAGVHEIRVNDESGTYRAVYVVNLPAAVYVLHCFQKKSNSGITTPQHVIALIRQRLKLAQEADRDHRDRSV